MLNPVGAQYAGAVSPGSYATVIDLPSVWPNESVKPAPIVMVYRVAGLNAAGSSHTRSLPYGFTTLAQGLGDGDTVIWLWAESAVIGLSKSSTGSPWAKRTKSPFSVDRFRPRNESVE